MATLILPEKTPLFAAFDPGDSTGIVQVEDGKIVKRETMGYEEFFRAAAAFEWSYTQEFVVEQFRLYPWKANKLGFDGLIPVRIIGALELLARWQNKHIEFIDAVTAKQFCSDARLKEVGWWSELQTKHERDAARHALYYLICRRDKRKQVQRGPGT